MPAYLRRVVDKSTTLHSCNLSATSRRMYSRLCSYHTNDVEPRRGKGKIQRPSLAEVVPKRNHMSAIYTEKKRAFTYSTLAGEDSILPVGQSTCETISRTNGTVVRQPLCLHPSHTVLLFPHPGLTKPRMRPEFQLTKLALPIILAIYCDLSRSRKQLLLPRSTV